MALVTSDFWPQGDFIARSTGMPDAPRIQLPHPVSGTGDARMAEVAAQIAPQVIVALRGSGVVAA